MTKTTTTTRKKRTTQPKQTNADVTRLINYILNGGMYEEFPTANASFEELARDVWPARMARLTSLAEIVSE